MYDHVIVPIDLAHPDPEAHALLAAKKILSPKGKLTLLHVIPPLHPSYMMIASDLKPPGQSVDKVGKEMQALIKKNKLPADCEIRIEHGRAARSICDAVTDADHQAIVMSSHNPTFSDFMLGSVAAQVVRHAECSVFVVRHSAKR